MRTSARGNAASICNNPEMWPSGCCTELWHALSRCLWHQRYIQDTTLVALALHHSVLLNCPLSISCMASRDRKAGNEVELWLFLSGWRPQTLSCVGRWSSAPGSWQLLLPPSRPQRCWCGFLTFHSLPPALPCCCLLDASYSSYCLRSHALPYVECGSAYCASVLFCTMPCSVAW